MKLKKHPLLKIDSNRRTLVFSWLLGLSVAMLLLLAYIGGSLRTEAAPGGILSLEFAGSISRTHFIVNSWSMRALIDAAFSIGLDYVFLLLYSTTIGAGCVWLSESLNNPTMAKTGIVLGWLQWVAGGLDAIENAALFRMLHLPNGEFFPKLAFFCALGKFMLILAGILYVVGGISINYFFKR
jgi:hypothetical protein